MYWPIDRSRDIRGVFLAHVINEVVVRMVDIIIPMSVLFVSNTSGIVYNLNTKYFVIQNTTVTRAHRKTVLMMFNVTSTLTHPLSQVDHSLKPSTLSSRPLSQVVNYLKSFTLSSRSLSQVVHSLKSSTLTSRSLSQVHSLVHSLQSSSFKCNR